MDQPLHKVEDKNISLTPLALIKALGHFDLDCCGVLSHHTADYVISLPEDGLTSAWNGRVWCNPPYSNPTPWVERMFKHRNGCALVLASTGARWFQQYCFTASAVLFLNKRPKFTRLDGSPFSIMRDIAIVAFSPDDVLRLKAALQAELVTGFLIENQYAI